MTTRAVPGGGAGSSQRPSRPQWTARPPAGWEPVADACARIFANVPAAVTRINDATVRELPAFSPLSNRLTESDLEWVTRKNVVAFLHGVAEHRLPSDDDLSFRRMVGRRTAINGLPLQSLIAAYQLGVRELWSMLVAEATKVGGPAPALLLGGSATIWEWMLATTHALSEGYQEELARREALTMRATAHLIDLILADPSTEECRMLAIEIGFKPDESFRFLALVEPITSQPVRDVVAAAERLNATVSTAQRGRLGVVVAQGLDDRLIDEAIVDALAETPVGIGSAAHALEGARRSLREAERALDLAVLRGRPCRFDRDWHFAAPLQHRQSLEAALADGISLARRKPHLSEAVRTFAVSGFSIAETARLLGISQNSVRYRLTRWEALTGWSAWTHDGLAHSLMALELASADRRGELGAPAPELPPGAPAPDHAARRSH